MAYADLQQYLKCLESAKKLHWIENPVDPSWEVTAITRQVFDRYGWNDRPALGFRHVGDSPFRRRWKIFLRSGKKGSASPSIRR
jgi:3-polyprenyl-4-hydroxybenzoate decarboxylase